MTKEQILVALAGNPNVGKTTIFNELTGTHQHVGNYPGVTVESKEGYCRHGDHHIRVADLPGTYSLTAYTVEEVVTRRFILDEKPDVVIDVVDASNLERNLFLAVQFMEMGLPIVLAFNMSDVARERGIEFDLEQLSKLLGVPIVPTSANKGEGMKELLTAVIDLTEGKTQLQPAHLHYGHDIEAALQAVKSKTPASLSDEEAHWVALKLLENDHEVAQKYEQETALQEEADRQREHLTKHRGDTPEALIGDRRYGFISGACQEAVKRTVESRHIRSDHIDAIALHPAWGPLIFLALMYFVFYLTFMIGTPMSDLLGSMFEGLSKVVSGFWPTESNSLLRSLLVDGVIGGVGGVLSFVPNILMLFLTIAILEDSGYMARAAFLMDRLMHKIGLHGKSFIPMLIGFGCSVPAILATRTLDNRRDRLTTMLVLPLISCGARFPIYALIIPAFFGAKKQAPIMFIIYFIGIALAVLSARLLRSSIFRGETQPLVMELPPYRLPTMKGLLIHTWDRGWQYIKKAGTIILGISIIMWAAMTFPQLPEPTDPVEQATYSADALNYTLAGRIGHAMEPAIAPMGFDWRIGTALIGSLAGKEIFVSQMGIVFSINDAGEDEAQNKQLGTKMQEVYTPLVGFCIMLFCLISAPCVATLAATWQESGSWRWALFQLTALTLMAYIITGAVYQIGSLLNLGTTLVGG